MVPVTSLLVYSGLRYTNILCAARACRTAESTPAPDLPALIKS